MTCNFLSLKHCGEVFCQLNRKNELLECYLGNKICHTWWWTDLGKDGVVTIRRSLERMPRFLTYELDVDDPGH